MIDTTSEEAFQKSWVNYQRPLFIVDEGRIADANVGEYVLFVFVQTDTESAVHWASDAVFVKESMTEKKLPTVFKGKKLFGSSQQKFHEPYRNYVVDKLKSAEKLSFMLTTSTNLNGLYSSLDGGIKSEIDPTDKIEGRELLPFLSCLKQIVKDRALSNPHIDVLVDRSFNLGLDPSQRKIQHDQFQIIGPGTLNVLSDGSQAALQVPNEFLFVSTKEEGGFSDLLVLPDSLAYLLNNSSYIEQHKARLNSNVKIWYWHDVFSNLPIP